MGDPMNDRCRKKFLMTLLALALMLGVAGCAGNGEEEALPSSGNPEADLRAEQRVGGKDKDRKGDKEEPTLYERLGGARGISALVDDMTARVIADPRVNFERKDVRRNILLKEYEPWQPTQKNVARFKQHMVEFLTLAAGGPAKYTGRELRIVHDDMLITNAEFDAMVGDVKASMDKLGIGTREQKEVLAIIETTRKQIVERT